MITQLEKEFIMSQAMKYRRFESGADKIGYIYITQLEELLNSGQEVDAVRRNEDAQSDAVGSINKTEKAEEQPAGEPTASIKELPEVGEIKQALAEYFNRTIFNEQTKQHVVTFEAFNTDEKSIAEKVLELVKQ